MSSLAISPSSRANCPGPRWTGGKFQKLAAALGLKVVL